MEERKCSKCGGDGPFPSHGTICKKCRAAYKAAWYQQRKASGRMLEHRPASYRPERDIPKVRRFKQRHPERYREIRRKMRQKQMADPAKRETWNAYQRERYHRKKKEQELMQNPKLQKIVQEVVEQAKQDGLDADDTKWMAVGAVVREARNQGVIGEVLSPEMNAAAQALVEQELKKNGKQ